MQANTDAILGAKVLLSSIFSGLTETTRQLNEQERIQLEFNGTISGSPAFHLML